MNLAERLQTLRKNAAFSQEEVAELLGVSRQAVSKWESGQGNPELENLVKLSDIYHVSADYILTGKESQPVLPKEAKEHSPEFRKTLERVAVILACAAGTVFLIAALTLIEKYLM